MADKPNGVVVVHYADQDEGDGSDLSHHDSPYTNLRLPSNQASEDRKENGEVKKPKKKRRSRRTSRTEERFMHHAETMVAHNQLAFQLQAATRDPRFVVVHPIKEARAYNDYYSECNQQ